MHADTYDLFHYHIESSVSGESICFDLAHCTSPSIQANIVVNTSYSVTLWGQLQSSSHILLSGILIKIFMLSPTHSHCIYECVAETISDSNGVYTCQLNALYNTHYYVVIFANNPKDYKIFSLPLSDDTLSDTLVMHYQSTLLQYLPLSFQLTHFVTVAPTLPSTTSYVLPNYT